HSFCSATAVISASRSALISAMTESNGFQGFPTPPPPFISPTNNPQQFSPIVVPDCTEYPSYIRPMQPQIAASGQAPFHNYNIEPQLSVASSSAYFVPAPSNITTLPSVSPTSTNHRFRLNPDAPEFQPAYMVFGQQPPPQFTTYMEAVGEEGLDMNDLAYEAMYDTNAPIGAVQQFALSADLCQSMMYSDNAALLQEVQVGLEQLIREPEEFDTWSGAIRDRLVDKSITSSALSMTAEMILQMVTLTPGVQYNFSRLCAYLSKEVQDFRQKNLLPQLRNYHENQRPAMNAEQLQNLLLFFAELYDKLELNGGARIFVLAKAVFEQIEDMLDVKGLKDSSVKTVIQALKLDGRHLESSAEGIKRVDALFTRLNALAKGHPALSDSIKQQIASLSVFRESNWGTKNQETYKSHLQTDGTGLTPSSSSGGMFFGPDGQPLSEEERAFLEENCGGLDACDAIADDNDVPGDEYDEFLSKVACAPKTGSIDDVLVAEDMGKLHLTEEEVHGEKKIDQDKHTD
uniref:MIF4G domain-containing protein n=1 Tax=Parascaris univalens TaxID=6257 RepID=A0A915AV19_PARUN